MAIGKACCDAVLRGWAYANGKLIYNLLDDHTVAVDAKTGREVWRTKMYDVVTGATMTMPVMVVGNKVFAGNSGGELGATVGSQRSMLIPAMNFGGLIAPAPTTRSKSALISSRSIPGCRARIWASRHGQLMPGSAAGPQSGAGSLTILVSISSTTGTSNPSPRVPVQRPASICGHRRCSPAIADTGMAKWAFQFTPHDQWDYDAVNENVLIDVPIGGKTHKALVQFNRNGFAYTIDRETGEVLIAKPFGFLNWASGIDITTAQPIVNATMQPKPEIKLENACPTDVGVKDWQPSAFSPRTGLLYAGIFNICMDVTDHIQSYIPGTPYAGWR